MLTTQLGTSMVPEVRVGGVLLFDQNEHIFLSEQRREVVNNFYSNSK